MKKFLISALAAVGIAAISLPAFALEHEFGGYWRTRAYSQQDFGPHGSQDLTQVDTRTRLFYTAKFSDNFKFVNKFEFNTTWGDDADDNAGGIGADGDTFRVKNSYVDLTFCDWNLKVGIQDAIVARGFLFDDDFAGINLTYNGSNFNIPVIWIKSTEGGIGDDFNDFDVDSLLITPTFTLNENIAINPFFMWTRSDDISAYNAQYYNYYDARDGIGQMLEATLIAGGMPPEEAASLAYGSRNAFPFDAEKTDLFHVGLNADFNFDMFSFWFTGIYAFGTVDRIGGGDYDVSGFLVALGGEVDLDMFSIHGQAFYASGDDDPLDGDIDAFVAPIGQSYYWSEIMGFKTFDNQASFNSPNERISNIWAVNLGATFKPTSKWTLEADVWYAQTAEDVVAYDAGSRTYSADDKLGTEIDLAATYQIFDNMNIRFVGAYLFADDATGDDDPWLLGTQLEFSF